MADTEGSAGREDSTGKARQAKLRKERRAAGMVEVSGWVPERRASDVRGIIRALAAGENDWFPPEVRAELAEARQRAAEAERQAAEARTEAERAGRLMDEARRDRSDALRDRDAVTAELQALEGGRWSGLVVRALRRWHRGRETGSEG